MSIALSATTEGFETALNRAVRSSLTASQQIGDHVENINKAFERTKAVAETALAFFAVEKFAGLIEGSLEAAQKLDKLAQSTGIAVETLGGLGFAAKLADVDIDSAAAGFVKLDRSIAQAAAGNKQAGAVYDALGISIRNASGQVKTADQVLVEAANKFAGYEDGANKTALALALFGRAGAALIPLLNQGGAAIESNRAYYEKYSGVTADVTKKAAEFEDTQKRLGLLASAFGNQLTASLLPALNAVAGAFLDAKQNGDQFKGVADDVATIIKGVATAATYAVEYVLLLSQKLAALAASAAAAGDLFHQGALDAGSDVPSAPSDDRIQKTRASAEAIKAIFQAQGEDADKLTGRMQALRDAINGVTKANDGADYGHEGNAGRGPGTRKTQAPSILTDTKAQLDPLVAYLDGLNKEGLKFKFDTDNFDRFKGAAGTSKAALVAFDVEFGKFSDSARTAAGLPILTEAQKKQVNDAGKAVAGYAEGLERVKALHAFDESVKQIAVEAALVGQTNEQRTVTLALLDLEKKGIKAGTDEYQKRVGTITEAVHQLSLAQQLQGAKAFTFTGSQNHDDAAFQLSLIGKTKDEIQDLTAARQIDLNVQRQAFDETGKQQVSDEALAALQAEAAKQKAQLAIDNTATRDAQRSALTGAKDFFNDYVATANDAASQIKGVLTDAFQGAEDAFVSFVTTGKVDFKSLATSIVADIARIDFKKAVAAGLQDLQGAVGGDSFLGKALSSIGGAAGNAGGAASLLSGSKGALPTAATANSLQVLTSAANDAAFALRGIAGTGGVPGVTGGTTGSSGGLFGSILGAVGLGKIGDSLSTFLNLRSGQSALSSTTSTAGGSINNAPAGTSYDSAFEVDQAHTGGILGHDSLVRRTVHPSIFAGAQRYHVGGIVGERPIIAKDGEGVFTPAQMRHLAPVKPKGYGSASNDSGWQGGPGIAQTNNFNLSGPVSRQSQGQIVNAVGRAITLKQRTRSA